MLTFEQHFEKLVSETWTIFKTYIGPMLNYITLFQLMPLTLILCATSGTRHINIAPITRIAIILVMFFVYIFGSLIISIMSIRIATTQEKVRLGFSELKKACKYFWKFVAYYIIILILVLTVLSFLLFIGFFLYNTTKNILLVVLYGIFGFWIVIGYCVWLFLFSLTPNIIVTENLPVIVSMKTSVRMVKKNFWRILGMGFLISIIVYFAIYGLLFILMLPVTILMNKVYVTVLFIVFRIYLYAIMTVIFSIFYQRLYISLRYTAKSTKSKLFK